MPSPHFVHHLPLAGAVDAAGAGVDPRGGLQFGSLGEHLLGPAPQHPRQLVLAHNSTIAGRRRGNHAVSLPGQIGGGRLWNQALVAITLLRRGVLLARVGPMGLEKTNPEIAAFSDFHPQLLVMARTRRLTSIRSNIDEFSDAQLTIGSVVSISFLPLPTRRKY